MGNAEKTMWTTKTKLVESWAEHYRAKTKEEKKRIFERMLKKNNKRVSARKSKVTDASPTNVTRPCDCEWGTAYKKNGFIPLAEDSDECGKCRGTGEVNQSNGRRLVEVAYYGFIAVLLSLMCILAAAVYMIYRQRDAKPHHLARIDSHRVRV